MCCETYCFAFQKRRFCTVKAAVLQCKTAAFAMPKRSYHFLTELSLQSKGYFLVLPLRKKGKLMRSKFLFEHGVERAKFQGMQIVGRQ